MTGEYPQTQLINQPQEERKQTDNNMTVGAIRPC